MFCGDIYRNRKVLLTGHTGFKGSWLALWLRELGADVAGYALEPPSAPSLYAAADVSDGISDIRGDIRDVDALREVFEAYRPEIVFHLAAQPLVRVSYEAPKITFDTNVGGTVNLLEAVRQTPSVKVLVNVTSDKCYENREWTWGYRENDALGGHDPYSASKGCAELAFNAYRRSFFSVGRTLGAASARAGNVIGGGDWGVDRLLPDCVLALQADKPITIRHPRAVRPWQHVLEPLSGYLRLGEMLWRAPERYSGAWNFGPDNANCLAVAEVVQKFIQAWGSGAWEDHSDPSAVHEATLLRLCCDKAHGELAWQSLWPLEKALAMTVAWYRAFYAGTSARELKALCVSQIREYEGRMAEGKDPVE